MRSWNGNGKIGEEPERKRNEQRLREKKKRKRFCVRVGRSVGEGRAVVVLLGERLKEDGGERMY